MFHILTLTNMFKKTTRHFPMICDLWEMLLWNITSTSRKQHLQTARKWVWWNSVRSKKLTENDRRFRSELKYLAHLQSLTFCRIIGCVNALLMKENSRFAEYKDFWTSPKPVTQRINRIHFTFEERREVKRCSVSRGFVPPNDKIQYYCMSKLQLKTNHILLSANQKDLWLHKMNSIVSLEVW